MKSVLRDDHSYSKTKSELLADIDVLMAGRTGIVVKYGAEEVNAGECAGQAPFTVEWKNIFMIMSFSLIFSQMLI